MTEEEVDQITPFIMRALRTLQLQNDDMTKINLALVMRIKALEEANLWNIMQGKIESVPTEPSPFVVRGADGKVVFKCKDKGEGDLDDTTD